MLWNFHPDDPNDEMSTKLPAILVSIPTHRHLYRLLISPLSLLLYVWDVGELVQHRGVSSDVSDYLSNSFAATVQRAHNLLLTKANH